MTYGAIILAAGSGSRMNLGYNKMLLKLKNEPLIALTLQPFLRDEKCSELIIVVNEQEMTEMTALLDSILPKDKSYKIVAGSYERQYSVYNGLQEVTSDIVLVHDGARPFITDSLIAELVASTTACGCAIPGVKVKDTIKLTEGFVVTKTLPRENLYAVQTPQACRTSLLKLAHKKAREENFLGTDEASLIERYTESQVKIVPSTYENIKITTQEDLYYAESLYDKYFRVKGD